MDIKCIALDLDLTTLNAQGKLSEKNKAALEFAASRGVHIVIASGRPLVSLPQELLAMRGVDFAVTSNGAAVYQLPSKRRIAHHTLERASVERILQLTACLPYAYEAFVDGIAYAGADFLSDPVAFGAPEASVGYLTRTRKGVDDMDAFLWEHADELEAVDLFTGSKALTDEMHRFLRPKLPKCYITSSLPHLVEISLRDGGKRNGVQTAIKKLGLSPAQVAAFGDGDNDADLLRWAGCGIAVANASPACLAAADFVTGHHDEDGLAQGIYHLLGNN